MFSSEFCKIFKNKVTGFDNYISVEFHDTVII